MLDTILNTWIVERLEQESKSMAQLAMEYRSDIQGDEINERVKELYQGRAESLEYAVLRINRILKMSSRKNAG